MNFETEGGKSEDKSQLAQAIPLHELHAEGMQQRGGLQTGSRNPLNTDHEEDFKWIVSPRKQGQGSLPARNGSEPHTPLLI